MEKDELIKSLKAEQILNQLFSICSLVLFLFGCSPEKQSIQSIEVYYIPGIFETPFSNCCDSTPDTWTGEYFVDTIITNPLVLEEISSELQRLKQIDTMYPVNGNTLFEEKMSIVKLLISLYMFHPGLKSLPVLVPNHRRCSRCNIECDFERQILYEDDVRRIIMES